MSTQLLIYKTAVPVSRGRHGDCFIEGGADYGFSNEINSVPLMAVEFPQAAGEYPIVFYGSGSNVMPAVILGVRGTENLFVSGASEWKAKYVPAFIRRYPFVFSREGERFLLCVDEEYAGFNREGRGLRLFGDDGAPTPYVSNVLKFLEEFQAQFVRTQRFCARIVELGLLEPMQAQVTLAKGPKYSLGGFMAINRDKLKALPAETLSELARTDELELLYLHLQSMRNFDGLRDRFEHRLQETGGAETAAEGLAN